MTEIEEAKRRKKRKSKIKVTYTTGDPKLNIKHFNKMMGTDFNNPSTEEAKEAAKDANANMGIESNGSSGNADIGEIVGGTNDASTDFGSEGGGEGMGESLDLHEAKREVRRYFIRPQHIFCANKAEVIKALIDIGDQNCSVYTLKYLGDEKDITKLTNRDIIYYYDDGILYDKNHVKVMDYDLYIKHEEERKKFAQPAEEIPDREFDKEYDDRLTHRTEFEESIFDDKAEPLSKMLSDLKQCSYMNYIWLAKIPVDDGYIDSVIVGLTWDESNKQYEVSTYENTVLDDDAGAIFWEPSDAEAPNYDDVMDIFNEKYDSLTELINALKQADKLAQQWGITWYYNIYDKIPEDIFNKEQTESLMEELNPFEQDFPDINVFHEDINAETHICCICGEEFEGYGNNPSPVKNEGRCCDACNLKFVIPARIDQYNSIEDNPDFDFED